MGLSSDVVLGLVVPLQILDSILITSSMKMMKEALLGAIVVII